MQKRKVTDLKSHPYLRIMEQCIICIEESTSENAVVELDFKQYPNVACSCKIHVHTRCWMQYIIHNGRIECPICHKIFEHQDITRYSEHHPQLEPTSVVIRSQVVVVERPVYQVRRNTICIVSFLIIFMLIWGYLHG